MITIEKIISLEDYHYVEGELILKISGSFYYSHKNLEKFTVENILDSEFYIYKKYNSPDVPSNIRKDHVSVLNLPNPIKVFLILNEKQNLFLVEFDKIIIDDEFIDDNNQINAPKFNSVRDQKQLFSTVKVKAYGLKVKKTQETLIDFEYEIFKEINGSGEINIKPNYNSYPKNSPIQIDIPTNDKSRLISLTINNEEISKESLPLYQNIQEDVIIKAEFEKIKPPIYDPPPPHPPPSLKPTPKTADSYGCIDIIGILYNLIIITLLGFIIYWIIKLLYSIFGLSIFILIGGFLLLYLLNLFTSKYLNINIFNSILNLIIVAYFIFLGFGVFNIFNEKKYTISKSYINKKLPPTKEQIKDENSVNFKHTIKWKDFQEKDHKITLNINSIYVNYETSLKESLPEIQSMQNYNQLLDTINISSYPSLFKTYSALIAIKDSVSSQNFPGIVVSMIQKIPYYVIIDNSCNFNDYQDPFIADLLINYPCQGYIKFGIKTPAEFLKDLKGDCDTRTLFAYCILKHFGYDVAIVGSEKYRHSVLGINEKDVQGSGFHINRQNKKYYLWELTRSANIGVVAPYQTNPNYWIINLN